LSGFAPGTNIYPLELLTRSGWKLKVGLALGGGAARGLAHLGVLRALEREKVPIDIVVGTSMGAILGGAWAVHQDVARLEHEVRSVLSSEEFRRNRLNFLRESRAQRGGLLFSMTNLMRKGYFYGVSTLRTSFLSAEEFAGSMAALLPRVEIQSLPVRFGAVTLDLANAKEVVICHGDLRDAARASSAIPGILPPVQWNGRLLIDGGWVDKVPVLPAFKLGADVVLAVDISAALEDAKGYRRGVDIMVRANAIKDGALVSFLRRLADVVIEPGVGNVHWADFTEYERCIEAGDEATTRVLPEIRTVLRHERLVSMLRPGEGKRRAALHMQDEPEILLA
jgi:NTE family protein